MAAQRQKFRDRRSGSLSQVIKNIEHDHTHHLTGPFMPGTPLEPTSSVPPFLPPKARRAALSLGLWSDLKTMRWMTEPASSLKMLLIPITLWTLWAALVPGTSNPFSSLLFISHVIPGSDPSNPLYAKGYGDLAFVTYYVILFSFIRQSLMIHVLKPIARNLGVKEAKLDRFGEQVYALVYAFCAGSFGLYTMHQLPTWYYNTREFWSQYPHWEMTGLVKRYYLTQFAFWSQQLLVLALRLEKPRKDYKELVAHHIVTIWLVGWSYLINLTLIGNAVFITMDFSEVSLTAAQVANYLRLKTASAVAFGVLVLVWTYLRHYLNLWILWSVWTEFDLIPKSSKRWAPKEGIWLAPWMKYQVFVPLALLQLLNLFWYFLICRILFRAIFQSKLADERSDDEDDNEPAESAKSGKKN